jgi:hypothetical protein
MIEATTEFIVDGWVASDSGQYAVVGRRGDEPIEVGDVFDAVFRYKHRNYPDEIGQALVREVEKPASLRAKCIHAYERSLPLLDRGMTGSLVLEGERMESVAPGWVLGLSNDRRETMHQSS